MSTTRKPPKRPLDHEPEAVLYARRSAGLTQQELADRCGVSRPLITEIELGTRNATPAMLNKLAAALNCPRVVLERKREPQAAPAAADPVPEPEVRRVERADESKVPELPRAAVGRS
jgi:transcriptional regulator with XRE-family HTH domain